MGMKYNATKVTIDGIVFDSKLESKYYLYLKDAKMKGLLNDFELQKEYILQPAFKKNGKSFREIKYVADFLVYDLKGNVHIIDTKGLETAEFKIKRKLFEYVYPELSLQVIKYVKKYGGWISIDEYKMKKRKEKREGK
jgi:hypothetical protein